MEVIVESVNLTGKDCIRPDHCGVSFYDNFFDPKEIDYMKFEKGIIAKIVELTCDQYFDYCQKIFNGRDPKRGLDVDSIREYANMMKSGTKFNTPYLNFHNYFGPSQEGRHRMLAMEEVCGKDSVAPVLWCEEYTPNDDEIKEYVLKKYGSNNLEWGIQYINSCLDKYLDRNKEPEKEIETEICKGYEIDRDDIIDYGQGWASVDRITFQRDNLVEVSATLLDSDEDVTYYIEDDEEVKRQK